jgi:hypothetical protein
MRNRHFPRLCRSCEAPMARQEDTCWNCGAPWDSRLATRNALRVIPGGTARLGDGERQPPSVARTGTREALPEEPSQVDADRWTDEGGSLGAEVPSPVGKRTATGI